MAVIKCKMCGGDLVLTEGSFVAECEYCGSLQTVPNAGNEKMLTLFARANRLRANCEFDKAFGVYETIVADFPEEAEAYWGLVLCKYGIEYVEDPATCKRIATCHRSSFQSVMEDDDFEQVLENSDAVARKVYREEAKQIEELRKGILEVSSKEEPYDIFICYKETGANGERTLDSVLAQDIYDALTEKGYRVFFSRITLENKLGQEYEPYIFAALNSAKVMLVVGTDYEHFNAVWVRNEWGRYIKRMEADKSKHLIPCYKDIDAYDMPKEFAKLQAQDLGKVGAMQDLLRGIDKLIAPAAASDIASKSTDVGQLLVLGREALEQGEWEIASSKFDLVLTVDYTCVDAYVGKLMAEFKCKNKGDLARAKKSLKKNAQYKQAIIYADETLKQELEGYCKKTVVRQCTRILGSLAAMIAMFIIVFYGLEMHYKNIVAQFYSNPSVQAEKTFTQLSDLSWYKKADSCTQYLLQKRIPGSYPTAKSLEEAIIPYGVTCIGEGMFENCVSLSSVEIPESVTSIGNAAFKGCKQLNSIEIPESVTSIGGSAFENCVSLSSVKIPETVTNIGNAAFRDCNSLSSIELPKSITIIGNGMFRGCDSLSEIEIPENVTSIGDSAFRDCDMSEIEIPESVTSIGNLAFQDCDSLNSITISKNITNIGEAVFRDCDNLNSAEVSILGKYMFEDCHRLTDIEILDGVTIISYAAFFDCAGLIEVTIPDGVTTIDGLAFQDCTQLKSIRIPASVTDIGAGVFNKCKNLREVFYTGTKTQWESIFVGGLNHGLKDVELHYEYSE